MEDLYAVVDAVEDVVGKANQRRTRTSDRCVTVRALSGQRAMRALYRSYSPALRS